LIRFYVVIISFDSVVRSFQFPLAFS